MKNSPISDSLKMRWPSGLKEECWLERDRPGYAKHLILGSDYTLNTNYVAPSKGRRAFYCLYHQDAEMVHVIDFTSSDESALHRLPPSFRSVVETYPSFSWATLLSLFRIHQCLVWDAIHNVNNRFVSVGAVVHHPWPDLPIVDHILGESFGVLLWQHQFESLFRLVAHGRSAEIMKFYRNCQQGKPGVEEILSKKIDGDTSFGEAIKERMIFDGVAHRDLMIREMALLTSYLLALVSG